VRGAGIVQRYPAVVLAGMQHSPIVPGGHWNEDTAAAIAARLSVRICVRCIFKVWNDFHLEIEVLT
jgi:hypothetical protein